MVYHMDVFPSDSQSCINIILHRPETERNLEAKIRVLEMEVDKLRKEFHSLENKYGYECNLNNELIDILRSKNIPFRPALESAKRR